MIGAATRPKAVHAETPGDNGGTSNGCNGHAPALGGQKTAQALAEVFYVSARTIRRDGMLARAVERLAAIVGPEIKPRLLSRESRLTREAILDLARLPKKEQTDLAMRLLLEGKLPKNWRSDGESETITLPREAEPMAEALLHRRGREWVEDFREVVLLDVLTRPAKSEW